MKCHPVGPARRVPTLCGSLDNLRYKSSNYCTVAKLHLALNVIFSQARYNNTPPLAGLSVYLLYRRLFFCFVFFAIIKINVFVLILSSFDFQCLPYASLKIMCDCAGIDN